MHEQDQATPAYETPEITDHGSLVDLTLAGHHADADAPFGSTDTAYLPGHAS